MHNIEQKLRISSGLYFHSEVLYMTDNERERSIQSQFLEYRLQTVSKKLENLEFLFAREWRNVRFVFPNRDKSTAKTVQRFLITSFGLECERLERNTCTNRSLFESLTSVNAESVTCTSVSEIFRLPCRLRTGGYWQLSNLSESDEFVHSCYNFYSA